MSDSNCSDTFCTTINVNNNYALYGAVILKNTNLPAYPAMVWAIVYDTTGGGTLTAVDSIYTDSSGNFVFSLTAGDYLFKAALTDTSSNSYKNFMPTYYKDQLRWDTANLVAVYTRISGLNINLIQGNNPGGPGFIGGKVSQGANKIGSVGDPMNNVYIMLVNDKDQPVAYTYSDMNGNYSFDNIAYGTYTITNDVLGKKAFGLQVTISSQQPKQSNINVEINSVSVVVVNGVSITQANNTLSGVSIYPNPVLDMLTIHQPSTEKYKLDIADMTGKIVLSSTVTENNSAIDIKDLKAGIYMIKLIDKNGNLGVYKIVKN
ncbi:MAG: carboxypeptidase regulatory-like domain-containing protein [Bacteroidetes bacterium]|nr:carboxypeptidase regulatory-like domain-containing protein [Bacteroidota bacterium]